MSKYSDSSKDYTIAYVQGRLKRIEIRFQKDDYKERIEPAIIKSGLPVAAFIKQAVDEKISKMSSE